MSRLHRATVSKVSQHFGARISAAWLKLIAASRTTLDGDWEVSGRREGGERQYTHSHVELNEGLRTYAQKFTNTNKHTNVDIFYKLIHAHAYAYTYTCTHVHDMDASIDTSRGDTPVASGQRHHSPTHLEADHPTVGDDVITSVRSERGKAREDAARVAGCACANLLLWIPVWRR